jgi:hypothetical protein
LASLFPRALVVTEQDKVKSLMELFPPDREDTSKLHPDLKPWVTEHEEFGIQLMHPLVYQVIGFSYALANKQYEAKTALVEERIKEENFSGAIWLYERPWRMEILKQWVDDNFIPQEQLRELLPAVWIDTEIPQGNQDDPMYLFREAEWITDAEWKDYEKLPDKLTLYRGVDGVCELTEDGPSWTLDRKVADFFGNRYAEGDVYKIVIPKRASLAFFTGRAEAEIILDFDHPEWEDYREQIVRVA